MALFQLVKYQTVNGNNLSGRMVSERMAAVSATAA